MNISQEDMALVSNEFMYALPSKDKIWMERYLENKRTSKLLLPYYLTFKSIIKNFNMGRFIQLFIDHTGIFLAPEAIRPRIKLLMELEAAVAKAEAEKDLETLSNIKMGKFKVNK